jgi:quinohemoprotein ethanol dehydrogenase
MKLRRLLSAGLLGLAALAAAAPPRPAQVDSRRLLGAEKEAASWLSDGRTYSAQRYSPLTQIDAGNVGKLGLAWYDELDTMRGVEATPVYADGMLYNISAWNIATAYDARTGRRLWTYDPKVPREMGRYACCEPVARGLALWNGKVIIATLDGRLIGLDAATGKPVWTTRTFDNKTMPYTITGAPRVFDGMVVVGNSGGDLGVRGFVAAWDADTGAKRWKFFLTPGNPANGPDHEASDPVMAMAAKTWSGAHGGRWAAARTRGIRSPTIRRRSWSMSAPATDRRCRATIAVRARATICSSARSWR